MSKATSPSMLAYELACKAPCDQTNESDCQVHSNAAGRKPHPKGTVSWEWPRARQFLRRLHNELANWTDALRAVAIVTRLLHECPAAARTSSRCLHTAAEDHVTHISLSPFSFFQVYGFPTGHQRRASARGHQTQALRRQCNGLAQAASTTPSA